MSMTSKTIEIFLPSGEPHGIRIARFTTGTVKVIELPRIRLPQFPQVLEKEKVAIYFLLGESTKGDEQIYIGQTIDIEDRLSKHKNNKHFWQRAFIVLSQSNTITLTHVMFLEWHCLKEAQRAGRFPVKNLNSGSETHTTAPLRSDCLQFFEEIKTLFSTLGFPVFDPIVPDEKVAEENELLICKGLGADALGIYTTEGLVVLKGSLARKDVVPSFAKSSAAKARNKLVEGGVVGVDGEHLVFLQDHLFRSPNAAAAFLKGRSLDGWRNWRNKSGQTLYDLEQKASDS